MRNIVASCLVAAGCAQGSGAERAEAASRTLTLRGSDTMVILAQRWAQAFMASHPDARVQVSGGGSGTGIAALLHGTADLATVSRELQERELEHIEAERGHAAVVIPVAIDAVAVYVNEASPMREVELADLREVFRGRITSWRELGGRGPIVLYSRENNSGTYAFFKERVLQRLDFAAEAQSLPGTAAVIHAVSRDRNGIGYGGIGFGTGVRALAVSDGGDAVAPNEHTAVDGRYPLARPLYLVSVGEPRGLAAELSEWVRGAEGQSVVQEAGFFPLGSR